MLKSTKATKAPTGPLSRSTTVLKANGGIEIHVGDNINKNEAPFHAVDNAAKVVEELASSTAAGLSSDEAARRIKEFGPNTLTPARKATFLERLWAQLNNLVIFILLCAAIIEGALQSWPEFGMVVGVIVINTIIGLVQEGKAEKAAEAIKAMMSQTAKVKRDGQVVVIPAEELVPGDVVLLKSGDKVPADLRLITASNLQVQEAMLTGESVPVSKNLKGVAPDAPLGDRKCMCYSATTVVSGQAEGIVVGTGDNAEIGQINTMVNTVDVVSNNLMRQMTIFGRWLGLLVAIIAVLAFLLARFRANQSYQTSFESAVSIAVAIIPEGLPAMVTIVLAIGTTVMARNNAIIRQLPAVETLGSVTVICSDKTGTLTKNEMTVVKIRTAANLVHVSGVGYAPTGKFSVGKGGTHDANAKEEDLAPMSQESLAALRVMMEGSMLCNDSALSKAADESTGAVTYSATGAPTEVSLLTAGAKMGIDLSDLKERKPRVASVPFESEHKFMATVHQEGTRRVMYVKGAPDRLLPLCNNQVAGEDLSKVAPLDLDMWHRSQEELSSQGLRMLALCRADLADSESLEVLSPSAILSRGRFLSLVMMVAILDPPREEAVTSIKEAHRAGINVKMITGDHALTAVSIGRMLGISGDRNLVLTGPEVDKMSDEELQDRAMDCNIYARASPENKLRIVRALQARRQVVSMTGDGVNDAPALKAADVGVAMGITGTDVSKEAAKMLLADDNFASIVAAVREGRRVWDNIRKILIFNMPVNVAQGMSVVYAFILGFTSAPLTALQVLLVNLVTAVTLGLALAAEPPEPTVMERPPRRPNKHLVGKLLVWRMLFVSHILVVLVVGSFYWGGQQSLDLEQRRAEAFNVLVGGQVAYFVTCRFLKTSTVHLRVFKGNLMALLSVTFIVALMVFVTYVPGVNHFFHMAPMIGIQWARVVVCVVIVYVVVEVEKALVDPLLMPMMRPVLRWIDAHVPSCLSFEWRPPAMPRVSNAAAQLCRKPAVKGDALDGGANGATAT